MASHQQQFTFINVSDHKRANKKRIKSHVANDINRRKRHIAVKEYQDFLSSQSSDSSRSSQSPSLKHDFSPPIKDESTSPPVQPEHEQSHHPSELKDESRRKTNQSPTATLDVLTRHSSGWTSSVIKSVEQSMSTTNKKISSSRTTGDELEQSSSSIIRRTVNERERSPNKSHVDRIKAPVEFEILDFAFRNVKTYLHGRHETIWSQLIKQNPLHFQNDIEVGIWRECFFLTFELLKIGRSQQAFSILDTALGATSSLMKRQHPSLLNVLVEIMQEAKDIRDPKLCFMIQSYLTQMALAILGKEHPIALLMKSMRSITAYQHTDPEVLFQYVVDTLGHLFGETDFHTLGIYFGAIRRHLLKQNIKAAQSCVDLIEGVWKESFLPGSPPLQVLAIEKAKVELAVSQKPIDLTSVVEPTVKGLEDVAVMMRQATSPPPLPPPPLTTHTSSSTSSSSSSSTSALPLTDPQAISNDANIRLKALGQRLVGSSYHALSLHVYTHVDEVLAPTKSSSPMSMEEVSFPTKVAKIMLDMVENQQPRSRS